MLVWLLYNFMQITESTFTLSVHTKHNTSIFTEPQNLHLKLFSGKVTAFNTLNAK